MVVNVKELGDALGLGARSIQRLAKIGVLEKQRHGQYDLKTNLSRYLRHLLAALQSHEIERRRYAERAFGRWGQVAFCLDELLAPVTLSADDLSALEEFDSGGSESMERTQ